MIDRSYHVDFVECTFGGCEDSAVPVDGESCKENNPIAMRHHQHPMLGSQSPGRSGSNWQPRPGKDAAVADKSGKKLLWLNAIVTKLNCHYMFCATACTTTRYLF